MDLISVVYIALVSSCVVDGASMGSRGRITLNDGVVCKVDNGAKNSLEIKDKTKEEKVINAQLEFPEDITDKYTLNFVVDKWENSAWQKDFMKINGKACERINKLVPGFVVRMNKFTKPAIDKQCPFKKGKYTVSDLRNLIDTSELDVPTVPFGRFRFVLQVKEGSKLVTCIKFDNVIIEPK